MEILEVDPMLMPDGGDARNAAATWAHMSIIIASAAPLAAMLAAARPRPSGRQSMRESPAAARAPPRISPFVAAARFRAAARIRMAAAQCCRSATPTPRDPGSTNNCACNRSELSMYTKAPDALSFLAKIKLLCSRNVLPLLNPDTAVLCAERCFNLWWLPSSH